MPTKKARTIYFNKARLDWLEAEMSRTRKPLSQIVGECIDARIGLKSADEVLIRDIVREEIGKHRDWIEELIKKREGMKHETDIGMDTR